MPPHRLRRQELSEQPEALVLRQARAGVADAFVEIMRRHNRRAFRVAWSLVRNRMEAEDIVQDAYLKAFTNLARFSGDASFATWLTRIVINEALMRRRRWQHRLEAAPAGTLLRIEPGAEQPDLPDSGETPEMALSRDELRRRLEAAVAALPDEFRAVFVLRVVEGLSIEETAAVLTLNPDTVKTRLFRARRRLREALEHQLADAFQELLPFDGARCAALVARVTERLSARGLIQPP